MIVDTLHKSHFLSCRLVFGDGYYFYDTVKGIWEDVSNTGGRPDRVSCPADAGVEQVESDEDEDAYYDDDDDESNEWWLDTDDDGVEQAIERRTGERGNITNIF